MKLRTYDSDSPVYGNAAHGENLTYRYQEVSREKYLHLTMLLLVWGGRDARGDNFTETEVALTDVPRPLFFARIGE